MLASMTLPLRAAALFALLAVAVALAACRPSAPAAQPFAPEAPSAAAPAAAQPPAAPAAPAAPMQAAPAAPAAPAAQPAAPAAPAQQTASSPSSTRAADPAPAPDDRPTMTVGGIWLDNGLDPALGAWVGLQMAMSETLFRLSEDSLSPEPWLAAQAIQVNPLTWQIDIRPGVRFHNGAPMDAAAVKASLDRITEMSEAAAGMLMVDAIGVLDEDTIVITTTEPRPILPGLLTTPIFGIVDAAAAERMGDAFDNAPVLTGPYMPAEFVLNERVVTVANDDYWGGPPPLAGVEIIAVADTKSRELALQAGDVDLALNISPEWATSITPDEAYHASSAAVGANVVMWWVNHESGPMSDPAVRQAVAKAIDRAGIAEVVAPAGSGAYAEYLLPSAAVPQCSAPGAQAYDPDGARALLAEAGYADSDGDGIVEKDGAPARIVIGAYPQRPQLPVMAEIAQAMLAEVGIGVEVNVTEWSAVKEPTWDMFGWYSGVISTGDPHWNIQKFFGESSLGTGGNANFGRYANDNLYGILSDMGAEAQPDRRYALACDALALIGAETAVLPVAHVSVINGVSNDVTGFTPHPARFYFLNGDVGLTR